MEVYKSPAEKATKHEVQHRCSLWVSRQSALEISQCIRCSNSGLADLIAALVRASSSGCPQGATGKGTTRRLKPCHSRHWNQSQHLQPAARCPEWIVAVPVSSALIGSAVGPSFRHAFPIICGGMCTDLRVAAQAHRTRGCWFSITGSR